MSAGYSQRPLAAKLGIRLDSRVYFANVPTSYRSALGEIIATLTITSEPIAPLDFIHLFVTAAAELEQAFPLLKAALAPNGMLWISWPKGKSKFPSTLNDNIIRKIGLAHGLVDVKVCAIDEDWSGLKFVYRRKDRE